MGAGSGHLEGALGAFVALDVAQIQPGSRELWRRYTRPEQQLGALEVVDQLDKVVGRNDVDVVAGPGGLRTGGGRADDAFALCLGGDGCRQGTGYRQNGSVESKLAEHDIAGKGLTGQDTGGGQQAGSNGQIVMAAGLGQVGRGEVDGDAFGGNDSPTAVRAARMRSRLSATALSGRPTMVKPTKPEEICTWTSTGTASMPWKATVLIRAT